MKKLLIVKTCIHVIGVVCLLGTISCEDPEELKKYKEDPPWLGGSSIETLEKWTNESNGSLDSSYSMFLKLMEVSEYEESIEKSLFTLFVPSDNAFEKFLNKRGIDSIGQLDIEEAQRIFTLHIQRNPLSRYYLVYDHKFDVVQDEEGEYGPLFFRQPTWSTAEEYSDTVKYFETYKGEVLSIYGDLKYVPIFSTELMKAIGGTTDGSDYEFICRDTKWSKSGLNWHNSEILKAEIPTSNGFIYIIDRVIEPPPNVDGYLQRNPDKYGTFYDIMQRFATYGNRKLDKDREYYMYKKSYQNIYDLANEAGSFPGHLQEKDIFTAIIPTNEALQEYLDTTLIETYLSLDSVPLATLEYFIKAHVSKNLLLASKLKNNFFNSFGDQLQIDTENEITDAFLCSNGVVYGINKVLEPYAFRLTPGALFFNSEYSTFLVVLMQSGYISALTFQDVEVTLFAPDNKAMEAYGIRYERGANEIQKLNEEGQWKAMDQEEIETFATNHILLKESPDFSGYGFLEMKSGNYIKYDNKILAAGGNIEDNDVSNIKIEQNKKNGTLYLLDNVLKEPVNPIGEFIWNDPELSEFRTILDSLNMFTKVPKPGSNIDSIHMLNLAGESEFWTAFIPTNTALANDPLPIEASDSLKQLFVNYHFINGEVIFDDGKKSGDFETMQVLINEETSDFEYVKLSIDNTLNNMVITDSLKQQVTVPHSTANNMVQKGVVHKINTTLKWE